MSNVVPFPERFKSNGAREAMLAIFDKTFVHTETVVDQVLAELWTRGFKVVPLEPSDDR